MKKSFLALLFFAGTTAALSQVDKVDDRQETDQDKIEQEAPLSAQVNLERNTRIETQRLQNEKAAARRAKKIAKEKAKQEAVIQVPLKK